MIKPLPVMLGKVLGYPIRVSLAVHQNIITPAHHVGQGGANLLGELGSAPNIINREETTIH
jgi:hypothetical protein